MIGRCFAVTGAVRHTTIGRKEKVKTTGSFRLLAKSAPGMIALCVRTRTAAAAAGILLSHCSAFRQKGRWWRMKISFPNPCLTCEDRESCDASGVTWRYCQRKRTWINWWWRRFKAISKPKARELPSNKFCYEHPDIVREWLQNGPCADCYIESCTKPCEVFDRWQDERRKAGIQ